MHYSRKSVRMSRRTHTLRINDLVPDQLRHATERGKRHQGLHLAELEGERTGAKYLRISTPIGPLTGVDAKRCLRFNWEQRVGYLAVSDLTARPTCTCARTGLTAC